MASLGELSAKVRLDVASLGADAAKAKASFTTVGEAGRTELGKVTKATTDVTSASRNMASAVAADGQTHVATASRSREGLVGLRTEHARVGAAAEKGGAEQVAALRLAEVASKRLGDAQRHTATETTALGPRFTDVGARGGQAFGIVSMAASRAGLDLNPLSSGIGRVNAGFGETESTAAKVGSKLAVVGLGAAGLGAVLTRMGEDSRQATAQLRTAVENTGNSLSSFEKDIDQVSKRLIKLGFDDEATARSLATLTTATQDPAKALEYMGLVADIAAARHISLESAADKVAKGLSGNNRVFKEFGITLDANASSSERAAAMQELASRVQGQAASQADSFTGKLKALGIQAENIAEAFGEKFGPALTVAGPLLAGVGGIVQSGLVPALVKGVSGLGFFTVATNVAGDAAVANAGKIGVLNTAIGAGILGRLGTLGLALGAAYAGSKAGEAISDLIDKNESLGVKIDRQINRVPVLGGVLQALGVTHRTTASEVDQHTTAELALAGAGARTTHEASRLSSALGDLDTHLLSNKEKTLGVSGAAEDASGKVNRLEGELRRLITGAIDVDKATADYHERLAGLSRQLSETGTSLDLTTEDGRENQAAVNDLVQSIFGHMEALRGDGRTMDELRGTFDSHIEDFRRTLAQMGFNESQIDELTRKYGLVPGTVDTYVNLHNADHVLAKVTELQVAFSALDGRTATLAVHLLGVENARATIESIARDAGNIFVGVQSSGSGVEGGASGLVLGAAAGARLPRLGGGGFSRVGAGFRTSGPRAIVGEGNPAWPEYVIPTDPIYRRRATALFGDLTAAIRPTRSPAGRQWPTGDSLIQISAPIDIDVDARGATTQAASAIGEVMRHVAREEITAALERVLDRAAAGAGTR